MQTDEHEDDIQAIEALVARQFASLNWGPGTSADWNAFAADFFAEASLYPSARPANQPVRRNGGVSRRSSSG